MQESDWVTKSSGARQGSHIKIYMYMCSVKPPFHVCIHLKKGVNILPMNAKNDNTCSWLDHARVRDTKDEPLYDMGRPMVGRRSRPSCKGKCTASAERISACDRACDVRLKGPTSKSFRMSNGREAWLYGLFVWKLTKSRWFLQVEWSKSLTVFVFCLKTYNNLSSNGRKAWLYCLCVCKHRKTTGFWRSNGWKAWLNCFFVWKHINTIGFWRSNGRNTWLYSFLFESIRKPFVFRGPMIDKLDCIVFCLNTHKNHWFLDVERSNNLTVLCFGLKTYANYSFFDVE